MEVFGRRPLSRSGNAHRAMRVQGEKRFAPRRKSELPALVYFDATTVSVPCMIRDMSTEGARLQLREGWAKPFTADVVEVNKIRLVIRVDRVMYDCRIVRRSETELGVKFCAPPKPISKLR